MPSRDLRPNSPSWLIGKIVLGLFFHGYLKMTVVGEENVPSKGALLLVSNHLSNLDPLAIGLAIHRRVSFLGKQEVFKIPVASFFLRAWGAIPLDRNASDTVAVRAAVRVIHKGDILGMFPEGRRSADGELKAFRRGAAKIALHFGLPVLPVAMSGTYDVLPKGAWRPRRRPISVRFGSPFLLSDCVSAGKSAEGLEEAAEVLRNRIGQLLEES